MSIREAAAQARANTHGSYNYNEAFQVLIDAYRRSFPDDLNPSLEQLWGWVDGYLMLEEASRHHIPLG